MLPHFPSCPFGQACEYTSGLMEGFLKLIKMIPVIRLTCPITQLFDI